MLIAGIVIAEILAGIYINGIGADGADIGQHHLLRGIAHHHNRHHRCDADNNPEHRQQRTHFIRRHRAPGHDQRFAKAAAELTPRRRFGRRALAQYAALRRAQRGRITHDFTVVDLNHPLRLGRYLRVMGDDNHRMPLRF